MREVQEVEGGGESDGLEIHSPKMDQTLTPSRVRRSPMFSLKWNGFDHQVTASLASLYATEELTDVTLTCDDGLSIKAHKVILAMTSQFFRQIFKEAPCKHPIVILKGLKYQDVQHVMQFVYKGEVRVREEEIDSFIEAAESLRIDGINSNNHNNDIGDVNVEEVVTLSDGSRTETLNTELAHASSKQDRWSDTTSPKQMDTTTHADDELENKMQCEKQSSSSRFPSSASLAPPPLVPLGSHIASMFHHRPPTVRKVHERSSSNESTVSDLSGGSRSPRLNPTQSRHSATRDHDTAIDISRRNGTRHFEEDLNVAEDLSKSSDQGYELSLSESGASSGILASTLTRSPSQSSYHTFSNEKRSTSWPTDSLPTYAVSRHNSTPNYLPLSLVAASAITSHIPQSSFRSGIRPSVPSSAHTQDQRLSGTTIGQFGRTHNPFSATSTLSALKERLTASANPSAPFFHLQPSSYSVKYGIKPATASISNHSSSGRVPPVKPKTKAIRSSQVPQSARYTAAEVDAMVDKVEKFPGPLVPCVVCQKFVKRERLRAHIHECHLLHGERIICQHCGIGLKSKGSFRVHIWRHKRGNLSVKPPNDP